MYRTSMSGVRRRGRSSMTVIGSSVMMLGSRSRMVMSWLPRGLMSLHRVKCPFCTTSGGSCSCSICLAARGHFGGSGDFGGVPKGAPTMKNHRSILFTLTSLLMIAPLGCDEPLEAELELDDRDVEFSGESP